jgi:FecR protein
MLCLPKAPAGRRTWLHGGGPLPRWPSLFSGCLFFMGFFVLMAHFVPPALGAPHPSAPVASAATVIGTNVELNGRPLAPGATLFSGDVVRLGAESSAELQLGSNLIIAAPMTELAVSSGSVSLRAGRLQVRTGGAETLTVFAPFFRANILRSGSAPGSAEIRLNGTRAAVSSVAGVTELTAPGNVSPYKLQPGETATLEVRGAEPAPGQGATPNQPAGQVSRLFPQVQIDRSSVQLVASVSDPVLWNDDLRSDRTGRAHITLNDGSQLRLGSDSELRVLQHDAQAQQTTLDLLIGRLRGQVAKVTRPGGKFEIRTPVGVAGLVGTDFSLLVTDDYVELIVFDGAVQFTISSSGQSILVPTGGILRIRRNGAVEGPSQATPEEMQLAKDLTDIPQLPPGNPPAPTARRRLLPLIIIGVSTGGAVAGITAWLVNRALMSPVSPSGSTPTAAASALASRSP